MVIFVAVVGMGQLGYIVGWRRGYVAGNHPNRRREDAPGGAQ